VGILDSLFGSNDTKSTSSPWKKQAPYLEEGFQQGKDALAGALSGLNGLPANMTAGFTPGQTADMSAISGAGHTMAGFGSGNMMDLSAYLKGGPSAVGQGINATYGENAADMFARNNPGVARTAGHAAEMSRGIYNTEAPTFGNSFGSIQSQAQGMAENDPFVQRQIDSAIGDVNRGFERSVGELNSAASGTGNINSTRTGVMESRLASDAMDRAADISTGLRSAAYDKSLNLGLNTEQMYQNNSLAGSAQNLQAKIGGADAMLGVGGLKLGDRSESNRTDLTANQQIGQSGLNKSDLDTAGLDRWLSGLNGQSSAYNQTVNGLGDSLGMGDKQQGQSQAEIAGELQKMGLPLDFVSKYMAAIGGNYGGTTSTQGPSAGIIPTILGGVSAAKGIGIPIPGL
jgi:hypothetical protein